MKIDEIASDTLVLADRPHERNRLGKEGWCLLFNSDILRTAAQDHHGEGMFNFLRMDSSVATMHFSSNMGSGTLSAPLGMWTRAEGD